MRSALVLSLLTLVTPSVARSDDAELRDSVGNVLRLLPAGRFEMGAGDLTPGFYKDHSGFGNEDERPVHPVVLTKPYYLAATEVSVGQFRKFVEESRYVTTPERNRLGIVGWDPTPPSDNPRFVATFQQKPEFTWRKPGFEQGDAHPVVGVSFEDAKAYCAWLSRKENATYRLPTEAEWEYAARAGTSTWFSFGDVYRGTIQRFANIGNVELERAFADRVRRQWLVDVERDPADRHVFTAPVGAYEANAWKLHDLCGNVWEWCEDRYLDTFYTQFNRPGYQQVRKRAVDPLNVEKWNDHGDWRVIRGGSWFNAPLQCRSSQRGYFEAGDAACYLGFRVVREASAAATAEAAQRFERSEGARAAIEGIIGRLRENRDGRLTLNFRRDQMTPEFLARLQELDEPVDLHVDGQGRLTGEDLAALAQAPQLRGLGLYRADPQLADADFAVLAAHPDLEVLQISETPLTDGLFAHLARMERLELLQVQGESITDAGLDRLPALPQLRTLNLMGTQSTGAILAKLGGARVQSIAFGNFRDEHAERLRQFPTLREVRLSGSPVTGRTLAELARLPRLTSLDVDRCSELTDDDFRPLSGCGLLQRLNAEKTAAGDAAADAVARLNTLNDLRIGSAGLTDDGVRTLCEIVSLLALSISGDATEVTDAGLRDLWRLRNLHSIELNAPRITGSGLTSLHELPALRWIALATPGLTDAGVREIVRSDTLEQLTIGGWQTNGPAALTDAGLQHIGQSRSLKQFHLFRKNSAVTDTAIEELRGARPSLSLTVR